MKNKPYLRNLAKTFKLFVLGSFVATRTASGMSEGEEPDRHEAVWMLVRDQLSDVGTGQVISGELRNMIEQEIERDLDFRVNYTYQAIAPDEIAQLDAIWVDHLVGRDAGADEMDRFLGARTVALRRIMREGPETGESPEQWRNIIREFGRGPYTG